MCESQVFIPAIGVHFYGGEYAMSLQLEQTAAAESCTEQMGSPDAKTIHTDRKASSEVIHKIHLAT